MTGIGQPMHTNLRYCVRCCMPETQEGISFDELGMCTACQSSEHKMHINWVEREKELRKMLDDAKANSTGGYNCIVPISGGKDSTFQVHVLKKVYGMNPLAVTFSHNWYSETGWYNLMNCLEKLEVDHIMYTPNRSLVNRLAKRSLSKIGDSCWHCHAGVGSFPLHIAVNFNIKLLIWGESIADSSAKATYENPVLKFDRDYFTKVSAKVRPSEMVDETIFADELSLFEPPTLEDCESAGVYGIHLGDYIFWDDERQMEFVRDTYNWRETEIEGTYKGYKSAECIMPGVHDFTNYLKRGFGRASYHASVDVRNGIMAREEGFKVAAEHDAVRPEALDYYLNATGMNEQELYDTMKTHQLHQLSDVNLRIEPKKRPNAETIKPIPQQIIDNFLNKIDGF